jgi:hypothetical protein
MTTLNKQTTKIFHDLISYLNGSDYVKIDNSKSFMPLSIDLLQTNVDFAGRRANIFALAHNFEQNGDLVPDPDMTFAAVETGAVYPLTIQNQFSYKEAIFVKNGDWVINKRELKDQVNFANMWLKNIKEQQGIKPAKTAKNTPADPTPPAPAETPAETPETTPAPEIEPAPETPPAAKFEKGEKVYFNGDQTKYYTVKSSDIDPDSNNFSYSIVGNGQNFFVPETDLQKITTDLQPGDEVVIIGNEFIYRGGKARGPKNPYFGKSGTVSHIAGVHVFCNLQISKKEIICSGFTPEKIFLMKRAEAPAPVEVLQPEPAPAPVEVLQPEPAPAPVEVLQPEPAPAPVEVLQPEPAPVDCEHDYDFYDITAPAPVETPAKLTTAPAKRKKAPRQPITEKISTFVTTLENLICDFYGVNTVSIAI